MGVAWQTHKGQTATTVTDAQQQAKTKLENEEVIEQTRGQGKRTQTEQVD